MSCKVFDGRVALVAALWLGAASASAQDSLAIRGGRILTMAGEPIEDGVVLIRDGKIAAIGSGLDIPIDARVIDASGKTVLPGFVDAHSSAPMSQPNETNPNVPFVSVLDSIDPMQDYFDAARRNGVTCVAVVPGNNTMIGGQAAVLKTGGDYVDSMVLKRVAGMKVSLRPPRNQGGGGFFRGGGGQRPQGEQGGSSPSRMGHLAALRDELDKAEREVAGQNSERGEADEPANDVALREALHQLVKGEMPAYVYCEDGLDVGHAIELTTDFGLDSILVLGKDCSVAAGEVADAGLPAILDSTLVYWERDERTGADDKVVVTEAFRNAGVSFVFQTSSSRNATLGSNYLWYQAAVAVKYGMPLDDALEALTMTPAKLLGIDSSVGSLEVGKDADLVILDGDPLATGTWVDVTVVDGQVVYQRDQDKRLRQLLSTDSQGE